MTRIFLYIVIVFLLFSCKKEESAYPETIVGKWCIDKDKDQIVEFFADGTINGENQNQAFYSRKGAFQIKGDTLITSYNIYKIDFMKKNKIKFTSYVNAFDGYEVKKYSHTHQLNRIK